MKRTVELHMKAFPAIPASLEDDTNPEGHALDIEVPILDLFLHYWKDKYGVDPGPEPTLSQFEYVNFITDSDDLRFKRGFGAQKEAKRNMSNELGRAFARWFLTEHLDMEYFADLDAVLTSQPVPQLGSHHVERIEDGDLPDFVAVDASRDIAFVEAKGRRSKIAFTKPEFQDWRDQVERVALVDRSGEYVSAKGYVVATRIVTADNPRTYAGLYAEDPWTHGERRYERGADAHLGVIALHYGTVLSRLRLDLLAAALLENFTLDEQVTIPAARWTGRHHRISGRRFIGGVSRWPLSAVFPRGWWPHGPTAPWDLDAPSTTFFGIEEGVLRAVRRIINRGREYANEVEPLVLDGEPTTTLVTHRDGLVMGPVNYFDFEGVIDV